MAENHKLVIKTGPAFRDNVVLLDGKDISGCVTQIVFRTEAGKENEVWIRYYGDVEIEGETPVEFVRAWEND